MEENNSCFPGTATVVTDNGVRKSMEQLKIGDKVLTQSASGHLVYSKVIMFMDSKPGAFVNDFIEIETENPKRRLELTRRHLIIISKDKEHFQASFAEKVKRGDFVKVLSSNESKLEVARVKNVRLRRNRGAYAPLTEEGTILVNGVLASCYALTEKQNIAHFSFLPWRYTYGIFNQFTHANIQTGQHWYVRILRTINRLTGLLPEIYSP